MSSSLKSVRETLLYAYAEDIVGETEFMLLYDANKSTEIYPYWNFERFDLENFEDVQCLTDFCIRKNDIFYLKECLQLPENIVCSQRSTCESVEGLCIFLNRLSYPCRLLTWFLYLGVILLRLV